MPAAMASTAASLSPFAVASRNEDPLVAVGDAHARGD
jgi:hypothetical protein